jgi:hypothetical protein
MSGALMHSIQDGVSTASLFLLLSICARVVIISCFPQYASKRVDQCMIVCGHTLELVSGLYLNPKWNF